MHRIVRKWNIECTI